jgi:hypothetical protein
MRAYGKNEKPKGTRPNLRIGKKDELLKQLKRLRGGDPESSHARADELILDYIGDDEIRTAFLGVPRWYS